MPKRYSIFSESCVSLESCRCTCEDHNNTGRYSWEASIPIQLNTIIYEFCACRFTCEDQNTGRYPREPSIPIQLNTFNKIKCKLRACRFTCEGQNTGRYSWAPSNICKKCGPSSTVPEWQAGTSCSTQVCSGMTLACAYMVCISLFLRGAQGVQSA